ncbi:MAG: MBL fold metallo-hydrolase [Solirubrobacterales bacterium]|nr:MBL fold metallo-hydrolase [Solirubrobacterales bacterium]
MRITVLGKSPAWQDAGGACSGYLIEDGSTTLLLDCGSGVFAKLRARLDYTGLDAVLITHLHADHVLDLIPFASALTYSPRRQQRAPARPSLHAPPGARERLAAMCAGSSMAPEHIERSFALREYDPGEELVVGELRVRFCPVPHFVPTNAVQVTSGSGGRFTFSADTAPSESLVEFAAGSDLLLIEATLPSPEPEAPRGHLTAEEAGEHGRLARVGRVVLTHISDELDADGARSEAARGFGGEVEIAREGAVYEV